VPDYRSSLIHKVLRIPGLFSSITSV